MQDLSLQRFLSGTRRLGCQGKAMRFWAILAGKGKHLGPGLILDS